MRRRRSSGLWAIIVASAAQTAMASGQPVDIDNHLAENMVCWN